MKAYEKPCPGQVPRHLVPGTPIRFILFPTSFFLDKSVTRATVPHYETYRPRNESSCKALHV